LAEVTAQKQNGMCECVCVCNTNGNELNRTDGSSLNK